MVTQVSLATPTGTRHWSCWYVFINVLPDANSSLVTFLNRNVIILILLI